MSCTPFGRDDERRRYCLEAIGRDQRAHELDDLIREKGIERQVVDRDLLAEMHFEIT